MSTFDEITKEKQRLGEALRCGTVQGGMHEFNWISNWMVRAVPKLRPVFLSPARVWPSPFSPPPRARVRARQGPAISPAGCAKSAAGPSNCPTLGAAIVDAGRLKSETAARRAEG